MKNFLFGMTVWALIFLAGIMFGSYQYASAQTVSFDSNLYYGLTNNLDVQALQEFLTTQGVYAGPITGNFFSLTLQGVKNFQAQNNITPVSGYFGVISRGMANTLLASQLPSPPEQELGTTSIGYGTTTTVNTQSAEATSSQTFAPTENQPLFVTPNGTIINANGNTVIPAPTVQTLQTPPQNISSAPTPPPIPPSCTLSNFLYQPSSYLSTFSLNWTVSPIGASHSFSDPDYLSGFSPRVLVDTGSSGTSMVLKYNGFATTTTVTLTVTSSTVDNQTGKQSDQTAVCSTTVNWPQQ